MGSPLGPLLSDYFLASLENNMLRPTIDSLHMYQRYMDDTLIICNENTNTEMITNEFNN